MMKSFQLKVGLFFFLVMLLVSSHAQAEESFFDEFEFMTGFGRAHLPREVTKSDVILLNARLAHEKRPDSQYWGFDFFLNPVLEPERETEVGCGIFWQQRADTAGKFDPYWDAECGVMYTTLETEEQATQGNFILQLGIGTYYEIKEDLKLDVGYRLRHYSNAAIRLPNIGVNYHMVIVGLSHSF